MTTRTDAHMTRLNGLLKKVRDLGMPLVSVIRAKPDPVDASKE